MQRIEVSTSHYDRHEIGWVSWVFALVVNLECVSTKKNTRQGITQLWQNKREVSPPNEKCVFIFAKTTKSICLFSLKKPWTWVGSNVGFHPQIPLYKNWEIKKISKEQTSPMNPKPQEIAFSVKPMQEEISLVKMCKKSSTLQQPKLEFIMGYVASRFRYIPLLQVTSKPLN